jgi:hypothetical protein
MSKNVIKIISISISAAGVIVSLLNTWINGKQMDLKVAEKVSEAMNKMNG